MEENVLTLDEKFMIERIRKLTRENNIAEGKVTPELVSEKEKLTLDEQRTVLQIKKMEISNEQALGNLVSKSVFDAIMLKFETEKISRKLVSVKETSLFRLIILKLASKQSKNH